LNISSFTSSFIKDILLNDVQHVNLLLTLDNVQIVFGILTHCFMQRPSYLLCCTPLFFTFIDSFYSFDSSFFQVFRWLLHLRSFYSLERTLAHKQASFPIVLGSIKFLTTITIAPTIYLGEWALIVSIIIVRLMVNQHPFLFETLT
jgi:hypothetical protein